MRKFFALFCSTIIICQAFISCSSSRTNSVTSSSYDQRKLLLRDEGLSQLSFIDIAHPNMNWYIPIPAGRDMQLVGNGRVLIGTINGYQEHEIATGKKVFELTTFPGTVSARRLKSGNTLLTGVNWQDKKGIVLVELDKNNKVQRHIIYPGFDYVRLVRETPSGTFLISANTSVFEGNTQGNIIWRAKVTGIENPHTWQALRLANGQTIVSAGFAKNFQLFSAEGEFIDSITGPAEVNPHFFAGFQVMRNGNYVVTNWQGHGPTFGGSGVQVLEYTPKGELVWQWKQDATKFSSLQGIIVLDGLDLTKLHAEDKNGMLMPVK